MIKSALEHNVTIGLHSSYQAGTTPSLIRKEKTGLEDHIGKNVRFNRHHFLAIREPEDMDQIEAAGVTDDFTMGYADVSGFRLGGELVLLWHNDSVQEGSGSYLRKLYAQLLKELAKQ